MASIIKKNGKYRAQVRSRGIRRCKTFITKSEAKAWALDVEANAQPSRAPQHTSMTIGDLVDEYIEQVKPYQQWDSSKQSALLIIKHHIGATRVYDYGVDTAMQYATARMDAGLTAATIRSGLSNLSSVITFGNDVYALQMPSNTCTEAIRRLSRYKGLGRPAQRDRRPSTSELSLLGQAIQKGRSKIPMKDIIDFAIGTTMRRGEIVALLWIDFDEETKSITVRDRKHPTQKKGNDQVVPLLGDTFKIVMRQPRKEGRIFPYGPGIISNAFNVLRKRAGIEDLHFHDLRHHGISLLFEQGYQIHEVSILSGHRSWNMLKRYTHIDPISLHRG